MRVLFMGTPDFADSHLRALIDAGFDVCAVVAQCDKPSGRGLKVCAPPVKLTALKHNIDVYQPVKVNSPDFVEVLQKIAPDVIVVVAYGQILSQSVLDIPPLGCINVHASLLPKLRGAAPIHRAIMQGEKETGITTMYMDVGMDTGDMILRCPLQIGEDETAGQLHDRLASLGAETLVKTLHLIEKGEAPRIPQDDSMATYAPKLTKKDSLIHWTLSTETVYNQIRGLCPWPGAYTYLDGKILKIFKSSIVQTNSGSESPASVVEVAPDKGILVSTGDGVIRIEELQLEGKRRMSAPEFIRGYEVTRGTVLGN